MGAGDLTQSLLDFLLAETDEEAELVLAGAPELLADESDQMLEAWAALNDHDEEVLHRIHRRSEMLTLRRGAAGGRFVETDPECEPAEGGQPEGYLSGEQAPDEWAQAQHRLGNDLLESLEGSRGANLEEAIGAYRHALKVQTREAAPEQWAANHNNLGVAYLQRLQGDRVENQERAIESFLAALEVRRKDLQPIEWARTLANLGNAYCQRLRGLRLENLERASRCYRQALEVFTESEHPAAWAQTTFNLGNVYGDLHEEGVPGADERAIECYRSALQVLDREEFPFQWAMIQSNLANVLADRLDGDRARNLAEAGAAARLALQVQTREEMPWDWARTQRNLGAILWEQAQGGDSGQVDEAVLATRRAMEVYTAEVDPRQHRRTQSNLAEMRFARRLWSEAYEAYAAALTAHERAYEASGSREARWAELTEGVGLPARAAYCLARLGRWTQAVELLEAGRARTWAELLSRREVLLEGLRAEDREDFLRTGRRVRDLEAEAHSDTGDFLEISTALRAAREELAKVVQRVRAYQSDFLPRGLGSPHLLDLASHLGRPIVYLLTTPHGSLALVVSGRDEWHQPEHVIFLDEFREDDLWRILQGEPGYLEALRAEDSLALMHSLERFLPELQDRLMQPLVGSLESLGAEGAVLIPCDRLGLLPLVAAAGDRAAFSLAPSGRLLRSAQSRGGQGDAWEPSLLAVAQPSAAGQAHLAFPLEEVQAIRGFFADHPTEILCGEEATLPAVTAGVPGKSVLHFACHGLFDGDEPLESALLLAGGSRLSLRDLLDGDLDLSSVHLAVLAACQTGTQEYALLPDESLGLPAGFLAAGVPTVVGTLWRVTDLSTVLLMERFYGYLLEDSRAPAEALWRAQRWLRDATAGELGLVERYEALRSSTDRAQRARAYHKLRYWRSRPDERPFAHPYYWAGFVVVGEG